MMPRSIGVFGMFKSNLALRVITALIGAPIIIILLMFGPVWLWKLLILSFTIGGLYEIFSMVQKRFPDYGDLKPAGMISGAVIAAVILFQTAYMMLLPGIMMLGGSLYFLFYFKDLTKVIERMGYLVLGLLYVAFLTPYLGLLRDISGYDGRYIIILIFLITWGNDTLAYFSGRAFGKHKLYEKMSPKKTIEGAMGGLIGGIVLAIIAKYTFITELSLLDAILLSLFAGALGQMGDLVESMFKRYFGVKDSSKIIPGHGGILDRIDALLFTVPFTFYYLVLISPALKKLLS